MNDIRLFEIVVYPESEDMYYEKWESIKESFIEHQIYTGNVTYDEGLETFKRAFSDVYLWNYNKLYGFIVINYNYKTSKPFLLSLSCPRAAYRGSSASYRSPGISSVPCPEP